MMYYYWKFLPLFITCINSALPPGYQDEIYCPPTSCLKHKLMPIGYSGPQIAFKECCRPPDALISRPKAWGEKLDPLVKQNLIDLGWHTHACTPTQLQLCTPNSHPIQTSFLVQCTASLMGFYLQDG
jgi:hypothetical protein